MSLRTTSLQRDFTLEVQDVDLSRPLAGALSTQLDDLLAQHGVLVFRRQLLSEEDLVRFAGGFGELEKTIYTKGVSPYHPEVIYISNLKYPDGGNVGLLGDQELHWHSDQTYRTRPATGSMLYGLEVTSTSGCTYWANQYLAYEALPADVKRAIEGRTGVFSYAKRLEVFYPKDQKNDQDLKKRAPDAAVHPIVLTNPVTGRKHSMPIRSRWSRSRAYRRGKRAAARHPAEHRRPPRPCTSIAGRKAMWCSGTTAARSTGAIRSMPNRRALHEADDDLLRGAPLPAALESRALRRASSTACACSTLALSSPGPIARRCSPSSARKSSRSSRRTAAIPCGNSAPRPNAATPWCGCQKAATRNASR